MNLEKTTSLQENVNPGLLQSMREGNPLKLTGIPQRKPQENDAIPKIAPKWLKYDKQVRQAISCGVVPLLIIILYSESLFHIKMALLLTDCSLTPFIGASVQRLLPGASG